MQQFNKVKLNRAIVVLFHHTLAMEPSSRIRISPENKRRIRRDREAMEHLIEFASAAMKELGVGEDHTATGTRKRLNVRPADIRPVH